MNLVSNLIKIHNAYMPLQSTSWDDDAKKEIVDFFTRRMSVTNSISGETREVTHFQYVSWPDYGVPVMADTMLNFRNKVCALDFLLNRNAATLNPFERFHATYP